MSVISGCRFGDGGLGRDLTRYQVDGNQSHGDTIESACVMPVDQ
jgi:hypothetical protein